MLIMEELLEAFNGRGKVTLTFWNTASSSQFTRNKKATIYAYFFFFLTHKLVLIYITGDRV